MRGAAKSVAELGYASSMVPAWAILPTARQLITQSFRHPNKDKVILIDEATHRVAVVPKDEVDRGTANDTPVATR